ncbi:hypothetical protein TIFTF001_052867 [Ficus carica]|uniref:CC-NBS-LRR protein n=1 Tax=Ficus carica TaxID=3494 RepID=A0AA88JFI0_FICCA|nr:hypothetical protein TIFTF001_052867 [Ficus carica]
MYRCVLSEEVVSDLCLKFRCLRVLSLSGYKSIKQLPDSIGGLRHLRHLNLSSTSISRLPESVCKLYNLQTLELHSCKTLTKLPDDFHRLINLRYLDASWSNLEELPESLSMLQNLQTLKLANCSSLTKLPKDFHNLTNLRYLDVKGSGLVDMPTHMGRMKSLETLSAFTVGIDNGKMIGELGGLSHLRGALHLKKLRNVLKAEDALEANLKEMKYLERLILEWDDDETGDSNHEMDVLDNLCPNSALKELEIKNYGGTKFPNWVFDPPLCNVVDVRLLKCKHCNRLPPLGQLPSLKFLWIEEFDAVVKVGPELFGNGSSTMKPFASLKVLRFYKMSNWEEWSMVAEDAEAFPKLRKLSLFDCKKLTGDLRCFLPSLTELSINKCPQLSSSLPEMPNVSKLKLVDCDKLTGGCHVVESFECLQYLQISTSFDSATCRSLPGSLKTLVIRGCKNLEFPLPHSYHCPDLTDLRTYDCEKLITSGMSWNLQGLPNLTNFTISCSECENHLVSFPEEGLLPSTITNLRICNLKRLKTLDNNGLQQLTSLTSLFISNCTNLQTIPEEGFPHSLESLRIQGCPLLEKKCEREGEYWNKISRIPRSVIDRELIN